MGFIPLPPARWVSRARFRVRGAGRQAGLKLASVSEKYFSNLAGGREINKKPATAAAEFRKRNIFKKPVVVIPLAETIVGLEY